MSSGQWEVVGKSKKPQNGKVKPPKDEEKKSPKNGMKVDDGAPQSVPVKSFYAGMEIDDSKPKKKDSEKKRKLAEKKAAEKPKPPKTIEAALQLVDPTELATVITTNKVRFSNAPLVWLKEVAGFLNSKIQIEVEDPTFPNQPAKYPACVVPPELRTQLKSVLDSAGKPNAQLFFDVSLTALANDMSRGQLVNGHRILLQMLALEYPEFCVASISKSASLRNSYQNRPPIGLSLLWALGQGGNIDFGIGLQVWQEIFFPIIDLKNYTKYIITYLGKIIERNPKMENNKVSHEKFFAMLDLVNSKRISLPKDQSSDLIEQLSKFKDIVFKDASNKLQVTFNQLMKKLPNQYLSGNTLDSYNKVIVQSLVDCLAKDDSCNATWRQLFHKCCKQSATLLDYISNNWEEVSPKLKQKSLKATVLQYKEVSVEALKGKKKDETVVKANKSCQDILDRMTSTRRFPWVGASLFLLLAIVGLISYDVSRVNGNFPKSTTGRLLKDVGLLEHTQFAWQKTLSTSARGYIWLETNTPIYYTKTVEFTKPYAELARDVFIVGAKKTGALYENVKEYIALKTPVVVSTIDQYAPGFIENVQGYTASGWAFVKKHSCEYYHISTEYLKTKVFVGEWAPEILQNKTESALNVTRDHVSSYYLWLRQQVNVYSEIP